MRLPRPQIVDCCVHITHRCQERRFLLDTDIDRKQYVKRLWQASKRFWKVRLLNYVVTSNHVHLVTWAPHMMDLSEMMHWLQGTFAADCNRRLGREGAFWRGRFHPTVVQSGEHLRRCLFYVDMNMVRAGVVRHPCHWRFGGHHELIGERKRYRVCDQEKLRECLGMDGKVFSQWYGCTLNELCRQDKLPREPWWSEAFAVGDRDWLAKLAGGNPQASRFIFAAADQVETERHDSLYILSPPQSLLHRLWRQLSTKR